MRHLYTRRNILIGLAISLLIVSFFVFFTFQNLRKAVSETRTVNNTLQSLRSLEDLMDDMQDLEAGQWGYIISGNSEFLEHFREAKSHLGKDTLALKSLVELYPERNQELARLIRLVQQRTEVATISVMLMGRNQRDSATKLVQSGAGKKLMDSIRATIFRLEDTDRLALQQSNSQRQAAARYSARYLIILVSALLIGLLILCWRIFRDLRFKKEDEKKIIYLASLTEKTSDAIFSIDPTGIILSWNNGAEEIYGYTREEAIGKLGTAITGNTRSKEELEAVNARAPGKGSKIVESVHFNKKGEAINCLASITALRNEQTEITGYVFVVRDITERKRTEQLLEKFNEELNRQVKEKTIEIQNREEQYRQIVETSHEGIWMIDKDDRTSFVNERMSQMLGYTKEEMIGRSLFDFQDEAGKKVVKNNLQRRRKGVTEENEFRFRTKDGRDLWTLISSAPVKIDGEYAGALAMVMDITERKKNLDDIRRSNESFQLISRTTNDAVWEWNLETNELWANETNQQLYGLTMADPVPTEKMWASRLHPDDRELIIERQKETLASDKNVFISEYRFNTADKGYREIYDRCYIVRNEMGKPIRMTGSMMDVTDSKRVEAALRASEENLRHVLSSTADNFYVIDRDFRVTLINKVGAINLKKIWGKPVLFGCNILDSIPEEKRETVRQNYERTFKGEHIEYEVLNIVDGKEEWVQVTYRPVSNQSGSIVAVYVVSKNITARKIAESALKESEQRYRSLIEQASDFIMITDTKGNFTDANSSFLNSFGYTKEELRKLNITDVIDAQQLVTQPVRFDLLAQGQSILNERKMVTRQGAIIVVEANVKMLPDGRVLAIARDIRERKKAELALVTSEETRKLIMNSALDAIICIDINGFITVWTPQAEKIFGWKEEEAIGQLLGSMIIPEKYREQHLEGIQRYQKTGHGPVLNRLIEITAINREGREFPIELSIIPIKQGESEFFCAFIRDITTRKQAEEQIVKEKELSDTAVNSLPGIFYMFDINRKFMRWNKNFETVSGYSADEIPFVNPITFFAEEDRIRAGQNVEDIFRKGSAELEANFLTRNGEKIPFFFTGRFVNYDGIPCMLGTGIDISGLKKAEEELRKNEEKYRTLVEQAVDAIALYDANGKILDVNTGSANLLGYSKEELMQLSLPDILTKEEIVQKPVRFDILQGGESTVKQRLMRRKDGTVIETEVRSQQLPDGRFLSVIRDLTERKKAQQQIEEEKRLSDKLIDSLPGIFYWYDEHGRFLRWNRQFEIVTGYNANEIAGMHPIDFFEGEDKPYMAGRIASVFLEGTSDAEADFVTKKGEKIPYYFKAVRLEYNNRPCLLGTGIDISDRKKAEQELEASNETLRKLTEHLQNIREEERSHIAREIHDELGQQLTVLKMDISWLNKKIESEDEKVKYRMKELVGMIDTTVRSVRKISSELRPSMLDDLGLAAAIEWQGQEFEKRSGIKVNMQLGVSDLKLPNNIAITLFRIFQESFTNVARHADATEVNVILRIIDNKLELLIRDNGSGFTVVGIEKKKTLGILGMRERVTIINGDYSIESAPGKGTTVRVSVPLNNIV